MRPRFGTKEFALLILVSFSSFAQGDNWTTPQRISGRGVTDCNESRITNDVWIQCRAWANGQSDNSFEYIVDDVHWYDGEITTERGPVYDRWRKCTYVAMYQCSYHRVGLN
jgi:hypothetical protein